MDTASRKNLWEVGETSDTSRRHSERSPVSTICGRVPVSPTPVIVLQEWAYANMADIDIDIARRYFDNARRYFDTPAAG